jgi:predicted ATPase
VRTVICGGPKTGKTTLSQSLPRPVYHTDDRIPLGWSEASESVSQLFSSPGPWTIEGAAAVRALRKWLASNPTGKPCDQVILLSGVMDSAQYTPRHAAMAKGVETIFAEIEGELLARGVEVIRQ